MPEIPNHERLIIVLGMARSGTTIFTYALCRHPRIALFREGAEAWLLENDCLPRRCPLRIARAAALFPKAKYVVLKRPWQEEHAEWLHDHMPRARFIVLIRDRESVTRSWATTGRWTMSGRLQSKADPDAYYDKYYQYAMRLPETLGHERCRMIRYEQMVKEPQTVFAELADWLGVEPRFEATRIGQGLHWNVRLAEAFPRGDWLLDGPSPAGPPMTSTDARLPFDLAISLITWRRPHLLERTLESLFRQLDAEPALKATVGIANNQTDPATQEVIFRYASRLDRILLLKENIGIGQAFDAVTPEPIPASYVMFSEDDMMYTTPFSQYLEALRTIPHVGAASGYHSKYHLVCGDVRCAGRRWLIKRVASTTHLMMTAARYHMFRPLALTSKLDFDWYLVRRAPQALEKHGLGIAVLPGGALHIGAEESTWSGITHTEYTQDELNAFAI
jgi:sulfotransferase family protein